MTCPKCAENQSGEDEVYQFPGQLGYYTYSVRLAKERLNQRPRAAVEVPEEELQRLVSNTATYDEHVLHVDPEQPGILARLGNRVVLLDGGHRGRRCLQEHRPFRLYMLSQAESDDCLVGFPQSIRRQA